VDTILMRRVLVLARFKVSLEPGFAVLLFGAFANGLRRQISWTMRRRTSPRALERRLGRACLFSDGTNGVC
jgi:hypothetical protein